jgi:HEAT repeat protein
MSRVRSENQSAEMNRRVLFVGSLTVVMAGLACLTAWRLWPAVQEVRAVRALYRSLQRNDQAAIPTDVSNLIALQGRDGAVNTMCGALGSADRTVRDSAAYALWDYVMRYVEPAGSSPDNSLPLEVQKAIPPLIAALDDQSDQVCLFAAAALGRIGSRDCTAVPALLAVMRRPDVPHDAMLSCALALVHIDPESALGAASRLIEAMKVDDFHRRHYAGGVLAQIGPASVPCFVQGLDDTDWRVRDVSALELTRFGSLANDAIPRLSQLLQDEQPCVRLSAAIALSKIAPCPKKVIPVLTGVLHDPLYHVRKDAAWCLGELGQDSISALRMLVDLQQDKNDEVQLAVSIALGKIDPDGTRRAEILATPSTPSPRDP